MLQQRWFIAIVVWFFSCMLQADIINNEKFFNATDGKIIQCYEFLPENPEYIIIMYHGGFMTIEDEMYTKVGPELVACGIGCYMVNARGHGKSGTSDDDETVYLLEESGKHLAHAPSPKQAWRDVGTMIQEVKRQHPTAKVYLLGHSFGGALCLNYLYHCKPEADGVDGLFLVDSFLGALAGNFKKGEGSETILKKKGAVNKWLLLLDFLTCGLCCGGCRVTKEFKYMDYTANMFNAFNMLNTKSRFKKLDIPIAMVATRTSTSYDAQRSFKYLEYVKTPDQFKSRAVIEDFDALPRHVVGVLRCFYKLKSDSN